MKWNRKKNLHDFPILIWSDLVYRSAACVMQLQSGIFNPSYFNHLKEVAIKIKCFQQLDFKFLIDADIFIESCQAKKLVCKSAMDEILRMVRNSYCFFFCMQVLCTTVICCVGGPAIMTHQTVFVVHTVVTVCVHCVDFL